MSNKKDKKNGAGFIVIVVLAVLYYAYIFAGKMINGEDMIYTSTNFFQYANIAANPYVRVISYAIFFLTGSIIIRKILSAIALKMKRHKSVVSLIASFVKYVALLLFIFIALHEFGVNTTTLLASAGILSLIVGLGAQPLIEDIIAGLFIVFEEIFDYGDIVIIDGFRGSVEEIGIRATKIMDTGGNIKIINNSDIRTLVNMTNELSLAICDVDIEYEESLARVENVIEKNLDKIKAAIPAIQNGPFYKGVANLGASGVTLRFTAECKEDARFQVERDLNRQVKLMFDANDINIPFTQVVLHDAEKQEAKKGNLKQAEAFIQKQKEESQGVGDVENTL